MSLGPRSIRVVVRVGIRRRRTEDRRPVGDGARGEDYLVVLVIRRRAGAAERGMLMVIGFSLCVW